MVWPQTMSYIELNESNSDDENFENCHLTIEPPTENVSKPKVWKCSRNSQPNTSSNIFHRQRYIEPHQPLLVLDPSALQEEARLMQFTSALNIDNSEVHLGPDVITINNTMYEPVREGNILPNLCHPFIYLFWNLISGQDKRNPIIP